MQPLVNLSTLETLQNMSGHAAPVSQMSIFNGQERVDNVISQGIIPEGKEEEFQKGAYALARLEAEHEKENKETEEMFSDLDVSPQDLAFYKYDQGERQRRANEMRKGKFQDKRDTLDGDIGTQTFSKVFDDKPGAAEHDVIKQYMASKES